MSDREEFTARLFDVWPSRAKDGGFVYFWFCDAPDPAIKIVRTNDLASRFSAAQTDCPYPLHPAGWLCSANPIQDEKELHYAFSNLHIRGEWFRIDDELREFVRACRRDNASVMSRALGIEVGTWTWRGKVRAL